MDPFSPPEAQTLADFSRSYLDDLLHAAESAAAPVDVEEREWLQSAVQRVRTCLQASDSALLAGWPLPELEAVRKRELRSRQEAWGEAVSQLHAEIVENTSANGPLVEVLFSHCRFEKLSRPGAASDQYHTELLRRRRTQYVQRLSREPEYAFLNPRFDQIDETHLALEQCQHPTELDEEVLTALREAVSDTAGQLSQRLEQARALANAALIASPEQLISFGLAAKPRKRASRKAPPKSEA